jgi:hypothetical protein
MHIIQKKLGKQVFSQRIDAKLLASYYVTKAEYQAVTGNQIDSSMYIEDRLIKMLNDLISLMESAIHLKQLKTKRNPLDTIKSLQSDLENPNWN